VIIAVPQAVSADLQEILEYALGVPEGGNSCITTTSTTTTVWPSTSTTTTLIP
jgi:hypothetical protein